MPGSDGTSKGHHQASSLTPPSCPRGSQSDHPRPRLEHTPLLLKTRRLHRTPHPLLSYEDTKRSLPPRRGKKTLTQHASALISDFQPPELSQNLHEANTPVCSPDCAWITKSGVNCLKSGQEEKQNKGVHSAPCQRQPPDSPESRKHIQLLSASPIGKNKVLESWEMSSAEKSLCDFGQITVLSELCSALTKGLDQEVPKEVCYGDAWVAQLVKQLPSAQVMIPASWD
ncbi:uncharacterized protein LOC131809266 [Mustela lutreola]|uniref:uncharacterized protein LOC131809266 n=1 Tax=Mustela lutreola TaxID=9666 RepID=UPI0027970FD6|nr:uncharacterized protein LOC131809266 [Mustela lutreola]